MDLDDVEKQVFDYVRTEYYFDGYATIVKDRRIRTFTI